MKQLNLKGWCSTNKRFLTPDDYNAITADGEAILTNGSMFTEYPFAVEWLRPTGLPDKNGKEIYEGDICDDGFGNKCKIIWAQDSCQFLAEFEVNASEAFQEIGDWCIIIGNTYEHPHLLNPKP